MKYSYKAKDGSAKTVEGNLDAESKASAIDDIESMGLSPVWIKEMGPESKKGKTFSFKRITPRDITVFTRQLASLIRSGVPILKALHTISGQTENERLESVVKDIESTVRDGNMLSGALMKFPRLFSDLYISMINAGESAGVLDVILQRLADAREKEEEVNRKVRAAIAYPLLIVIVGVLTVFVLLSFFMPRVIDLFASYKGELPMPTLILIAISEFFANNWHWILIYIALFCAIFRKLAAMEKGRNFVDRIKLNTPLVKTFILQSEIGRFARTLSLLIEVGISIDKAISLASNTMNNSILKDEVEDVQKSTVRDGMPMSDGLKKSIYFPAMVSNMAAVGEESGSLDESLAEVASFYEKEVEMHGRMVTSLLEPILILVVGAIVGFIVIAMLLPIFDLSAGTL